MLVPSVQSRFLQLPCICLKSAKKNALGEMSMNSMSFDVPSVEELMKSPLAKFITFFANDFSYIGSAKDLIKNWVH